MSSRLELEVFDFDRLHFFVCRRQLIFLLVEVFFGLDLFFPTDHAELFKILHLSVHAAFLAPAKGRKWPVLRKF